MGELDLKHYTLEQVKDLEQICRQLFLDNISAFNWRVLEVLDWDSFISSDEDVGVFLTSTELNDNIDYIRNKRLHVYPSCYEVISIFREIILTLVEDFNLDSILRIYHREWSPILSLSDFCIINGEINQISWNDVIKSLREIDLIKIIKLVFNEVVQSIINWLPIISNVSNREYFISRKFFLTWNKLNMNFISNSNIFSFEWPQWVWKSTQIRELSSFLKERDIVISQNLPKNDDPSRGIVEWENKNKKIMSFLERQMIARMSYEARYDFVKDSRSISLLDRSILSLVLFNLTMSRNVWKEDRIKDINELQIWYSNILKSYNSRILVLISENIFEQFFRMKKDNNYSNQNSDIVSQILENIFYRLLISLWFWIEIITDDSDVDTISKNIIKIVF